MPARINISGKKFGALTAVQPYSGSRGGSVLWECLCDCGKTKITTAKLLLRGDCTSCGCLKKARALEHVAKYEKPIGFKRIKKSSGRVEIKTINGFVLEHIFIMENELGRKLVKGEVVHHIDGDKLNNDIKNLKLMSSSDHTKLHHTGSKRSEATKILISKRKIANNRQKKEEVCTIKQS